MGIIAHFLAGHRDIQVSIRQDRSRLPDAIEEILRLNAPLISNRRVTTRLVTVGGRQIEAGERITLIWASANRDEAVFENAAGFRQGRDQSESLLYGAGIHVCPGAALARMKLKVVMEELFDGVEDFIASRQEAGPRDLPRQRLLLAFTPVDLRPGLSRPAALIRCARGNTERPSRHGHVRIYVIRSAGRTSTSQGTSPRIFKATLATIMFITAPRSTDPAITRSTSFAIA